MQVEQGLNQLARSLAHFRVGRCLQGGDQFLDPAEPTLKFLAADFFHSYSSSLSRLGKKRARLLLYGLLSALAIAQSPQSSGGQPQAPVCLAL